MTPADDVAAEARALRARLQAEGADRWAIVEALHRHHLEAAHACMEASPELAIAHLHEVEETQRTIASTATSGAEGLGYMSELYEIMAERARLHERLASDPEHAAEMLKTWTEIVRDPNGLGRWAEKELERVRGRSR